MWAWRRGSWEGDVGCWLVEREGLLEGEEFFSPEVSVVLFVRARKECAVGEDGGLGGHSGLDVSDAVLLALVTASAKGCGIAVDVFLVWTDVG